MKYIRGLGVALLVVLILNLLSFYALKFEIPEYLIGFWSCIGYYYGTYGKKMIKL